MQLVKTAFLVTTGAQSINVSPLTCVFFAFQLLCAFYGGTYHYSLNTVNKGAKHLLITPSLLLTSLQPWLWIFCCPEEKSELTCSLDRIERSEYA